MEPTTYPSRSDDLAFIRLVIEVESLRKDVDFLKHLVYLPHGADEESTLMSQAAFIRLQMEQLLLRQKWLQGIGGAILVGIAVQVTQFFLKK